MNGEKRWEVEVIGLPCVIERDEPGNWVVTIAAATIARNTDLAAAIVDAGGDLVNREDAEAIVRSVAASMLMPPSRKRARQPLRRSPRPHVRR